MNIPVIFVNGWAFPTPSTAPRLLPPHLLSRTVLVTPIPVDQARERISLTLRSSPAVLVGWSLGAMLALESATLHPQAVHALVLLSGTARFCRTDSDPVGQPPMLLKAMRRKLPAAKAVVLADFYRLCFSPQPVPQSMQRELPLHAQRFPVPALRSGLDYLMDTDLRRSLNRLNCPVVLIHGRKDRVIPPAAADSLWGEIGSRLAGFLSFSNAGHALPFTHGHYVRRLLASFIA